MLPDFANHLWQSTVFAAAVALACLALRNHSPRLRYWLWLAASLKFLVPVSPLFEAGAGMKKVAAAPAISAVAVEQVSSVFAPATALTVTMPVASTSASHWLLVAAAVLWTAGFLIVTIWRVRQWYGLHSVLRRATPYPLPFAIPAMAAESAIEPGVFGIWRPVLLVPRNLSDILEPGQLDAVLAHELCHVRHRDNLTALLHMVVESIFWFHPLVWWVGARLVEERERHCDETVLASGGVPDAYAMGILNVCRYYLASPLPCAAGVTGADLKRRVREIMAARLSQRLSRAGRVAVALAAVVAVALPFAIGVLRAQTLPPPPKYTYDVASVRKSAPGEQSSWIRPGPQGGLRSTNTTVMSLLTVAYPVRPFQFIDVPGWVTNDRFDVTFTPDKVEPAPSPEMTRDQFESMFDRQRQRMQAVLRDRFQLVLRAETRQLPLYRLTVSDGGNKLRPAGEGSKGPNMRISRGEITATSISISTFAEELSSIVGRHVTDLSGIEGLYDINVKWALDEQEGAEGPSIFTALKEQLGLKLESGKGPVPVFVIEKISKPEEN